MPTTKKTSTTKQPTYTHAVGRRKRAIARVRLYPKKGRNDQVDIIVNNKPIDEYFHNPIAKLGFAEPLRITNTLSNFKVSVKVSGSGQRSQLDAIHHGLARALVKVNQDFKSILRSHNLLTRDSRKRQRRMIGTGGKARRKKQSPKR